MELAELKTSNAWNLVRDLWVLDVGSRLAAVLDLASIDA